jgi:hypothetical protein
MMLFGPLLTLVALSCWAERAAPRQDSKTHPGRGAARRFPLMQRFGRSLRRATSKSLVGGQR